MLSLLVKIRQLLLELLIVLARSLRIRIDRLLRTSLIWGLRLYSSLVITLLTFTGHLFCQHNGLGSISIVFLAVWLVITMTTSARLLLSFVFKHIDYVYIVRFTFRLRLGLLVWSGLASVTNNLAFADLVFSWGCHDLFGVLVRSIEVLRLVFLVHEGCDLLLRALKELVYLTLPLVLDGVVSSLNPRWIYRIVSSCTTCALGTTCHLNSWLWSWGSWWRSSNFSLVTFLWIFHILTLDILWLIVIFAIIDYDTKLVEFIKASIGVVVASSLLVVTLSSFLDLIIIYKLVGNVRIHTWMIFII